MPPKQARSKSSFMLVRWLEDERVGVMPVSAAKPGLKPYVGAFVNVKWMRGYYEAEILCISGGYKLVGIAYLQFTFCR